MPRIRTIKPQFWDDIKLSKISRDARLLFIGMWNFADDCGVIIGESIWIKSKVFPYDDIPPEIFQNWINEITDQSLINHGSFREKKFYLIRNFSRHQLINRPNNDHLYIPIDCISTTFDQSVINHGRISDQSVINHGSITGGESNKERRESNKEWNRKSIKEEEVESAASTSNDAEATILGNQIQFERICLNTQNGDAEFVKKSLRKYHLFLLENSKYPKSKKSLFAGFEKWLINENDFTKSKKPGRKLSNYEKKYEEEKKNYKPQPPEL